MSYPRARDDSQVTAAIYFTLGGPSAKFVLVLMRIVRQLGQPKQLYLFSVLYTIYMLLLLKFCRLYVFHMSIRSA